MNAISPGRRTIAVPSATIAPRRRSSAPAAASSSADVGRAAGQDRVRVGQAAGAERRGSAGDEPRGPQDGHVRLVEQRQGVPDGGDQRADLLPAAAQAEHPDVVRAVGVERVLGVQ
jgi:hypothetical protein